MPLRALKIRRVASLLRRLEEIAPRRRRPKRMPRARQPERLQREYFQTLGELVVDRAKAAFDKVLPEILRLLERERAAAKSGHTDAPPAGVDRWRTRARRAVRTERAERAERLVDQAAQHFADAFRPEKIREVAEKFGRKTSDFQRGELDRQVRAALGVNLSAVERPVAEQLEGFAAANVDLIKTIPERYFDRLRGDINEAFERGSHPSTLAEDVQGRYGVALNDAERIARDQLGKLNADMNRTRQASLGVTGYTWRTMNDSRVRDEHQVREGQHFEWDDPPEDGHPGEPVQCRCYAEPDLEALAAELE